MYGFLTMKLVAMHESYYLNLVTQRYGAAINFMEFFALTPLFLYLKEKHVHGPVLNHDLPRIEENLSMFKMILYVTDYILNDLIFLPTTNNLIN